MPIDAVEDLVDLWEESPGSIGLLEQYCAFCYTTPVNYIIIGRDVYFLCVNHRNAFTHQLALRSNAESVRECNCVTPEQSCPACRKAAREAYESEDGELPY